MAKLLFTTGALLSAALVLGGASLLQAQNDTPALEGAPAPAENAPTENAPQTPAKPAESAKRISIRGTITKLSVANPRPAQQRTIGSLTIEGDGQPDTLYDRAIVKVLTDTRIVRRTADGEVVITFEDVREGDRAEAYFVGPVTRSYPAQAAAGELVILPPQ